MRTKLFIQPAAVARHQAGPIANFVERYVAKLQDAGYATNTQQHYLYCWERFGRWMSEQHLALPAIDEETIERYLATQTHPTAPTGDANAFITWRSRQARPLRYLLTCWREDGYLPTPTPPTPSSLWYDTGLREYQAYLVTHRGLRASTIRGHLTELRRYLASLATASWPDALARMTVATMDAYLLTRAREVAGKTRKEITSKLRGFFRYLFLTGQLVHDLASAVPTFQTWRLSDVPVTVPWETVERAIPGKRSRGIDGRPLSTNWWLVTTGGPGSSPDG